MRSFGACVAMLRHAHMGSGRGQVQRLAAGAGDRLRLSAGRRGRRAADRPVRIVALGDSLTAGFGSPASEAFPAQLEAALQGQGHRGRDRQCRRFRRHRSGGLARLDWSVPEGTDAVILELGANDMLRGIDPKVTRARSTTIIRRLKARGIACCSAGMLAPRPISAPTMRRAFDAIYPGARRRERSACFYPFFLDGVADDPKLNQSDGLHPTAAAST